MKSKDFFRQHAVIRFGVTMWMSNARIWMHLIDFVCLQLKLILSRIQAQNYFNDIRYLIEIESFSIKLEINPVSTAFASPARWFETSVLSVYICTMRQTIIVRSHTHRRAKRQAKTPFVVKQTIWFIFECGNSEWCRWLSGTTAW